MTADLSSSVGAAPLSADLLKLWQTAWPDLAPHPRGLESRLKTTDLWLCRRDAAGELVAALALRPPETQTHAHLRLLLVHPRWQRRGLGRALVQEARAVLDGVPLALGEERGHFLPGPTAPSVPFFEAAGFGRTGRESVDMACDLRSGPAPAVFAAHLRVTDAREAGVLGGILALTDEVFSPRWTHDASVVAAHDPAQVLALVDEAQAERRVIGFALVGLETDAAVLPSFFFPEALRRAVGVGGLVGGLGPIGIHPDHRGGGVGSAFMRAAMLRLRKRGAEAMAIDWTGVAPFYEKLGFREFVRYHHMRG